MLSSHWIGARCEREMVDGRGTFTRWKLDGAGARLNWCSTRDCRRTRPRLRLCMRQWAHELVDAGVGGI